MSPEISHYFKILADTSSRGNMDLWLAEHYLHQHHWSLAMRHIERCLAKGGIDDNSKASELKHEICLRLGY